AVLNGERRSTAPAPAPHGDAGARFGIGSLINRMTGTAADTPVQRPAAAAPAPQSRPQPEPEDERIEIPAFLRRQAN
ncbi:MAG: cell division protein FtsZ, partial [Jannaschia helgolandensis]